MNRQVQDELKIGTERWRSLATAVLRFGTIRDLESLAPEGGTRMARENGERDSECPGRIELCSILLGRCWAGLLRRTEGVRLLEDRNCLPQPH
jgi:hypothetical protein